MTLSKEERVLRAINRADLVSQEVQKCYNIYHITTMAEFLTRKEKMCSFCGLPACLAHGSIDLGNDKNICGKCINKIEIMERLKCDNEILYDKIMEETWEDFKDDKLYIKGDRTDFSFGNTKWLTNLAIDELRIRASEYKKPKPPEPVIINNIPIHKNLSTGLLEGEIFMKNNEKDVEVSNLGRVKYGDHILKQYDPQNNGYLFVDIESKGKNLPEKVYRLTAETWLKKTDLKRLPKEHKSSQYNTVHHISNNGYDNRIENLMWVTEWQHAMIHPWISIDTFDYDELSSLFYSYADIEILPTDYQRIINIVKRIQQLENDEGGSPREWHTGIIKAIEDLKKK